ncbi:E3 ubiquitin-protein ligase ATL23-like [Lolium rigidum]|uniref:E3 ubiquitin-protein ligase ATL23-like n=1 Tax=Lolium rigidum TaxID=89674 RepID=UPI001F5DC2B3|nr:E3 ubiquitin-protein ligase ATL23-like [Lolium rigidum]
MLSRRSSNLVLLAITIALLAILLMYLLYRRCRSRLSERRARHDDEPLPTPHLGLSMHGIAALPTFTYGARPAAVECAVCLQELEHGDVVRVLPACTHFFHSSCLDPWLRAHASCPVCRAHPEPERVRPGEAALPPPLPQLRHCELSPERPTSTRIFADIFARSPLRNEGSTSGSNDRVVSRSPSLERIEASGIAIPAGDV